MADATDAGDTGELRPFHSTAIQSVRRAGGDLVVTFTSGRPYVAEGAAGELAGFLRTDSWGAHYNRAVRGRYDVRPAR